MLTPTVMALVMLNHAAAAFAAPFLALQGALLAEAASRTSDAAQGEVR
ncbi:hypothetical protein JQ580_16170 [Bradyrhizobium japonicum]|jgi:hypothetical protein|nr:hypothetical protein [Bradyrhizobium japonicum]MBR0992249.1 hypothetical protein [Bradyrhizobium japonicum]